MIEDNTEADSKNISSMRAVMIQIENLIRRYSAAALFFIGILMLYVSVSLEFWSIVGPFIGVTIGGFLGIVALLLSRVDRPKKTASLTNTSILDTRISIILACLYGTAIIVLFQFHTYQRPSLLYVLFGGYAGTIAYQIARGASARSIVPQVLSLSFFTYWSSQLLFPAGMYGPDTYLGYVPSLRETLATGTISIETIYMGHMGHAAEFTLITGLTPQTGYYLLATLLLVSTVPIISILSRVLPAVSQRTALYATLIFSISSWMLGRGMHPNKLNYFYALILLLGCTTILLFRLNDLSHPTGRRVIYGLFIMPAIIFGHQFSAGAAMIFLTVIGVSALLFGWIDSQQKRTISAKKTLFFVCIYILGVIGNPIHQGPLLGRLSGLVSSVVQSADTGTATGGPGRYSELAITTLIASTAAQTLLFALAVLGAIWLLRQRKWEYDLVICWIGTISLLLAVSLLTNSVDTAPQRFYGLLMLFGFNVCVGALFYVIDRRAVFNNGSITVSGGRIAVVVLVSTFAVASLVSPVADRATSPVSDDIPHFRQFETEQRIQGDQWSDRYGTNVISLTQTSTAIPIERTGENTGRANLTSLDSGTVITYSGLVNRTGVVSSNGLSLGGRIFLFVDSPEQPVDNRIYANGQTVAFGHRKEPQT